MVPPDAVVGDVTQGSVGAPRVAVGHGVGHQALVVRAPVHLTKARDGLENNVRIKAFKAFNNKIKYSERSPSNDAASGYLDAHADGARVVAVGHEPHAGGDHGGAQRRRLRQVGVAVALQQLREGQGIRNLAYVLV